jgi:SAM-dependent methyltransferase
MEKELAPTAIYNDGKYLNSNKSWHTEDSPYKASFVIEIIKNNNLPFGNCADIGCGAGLVTEILAINYPDARFTGFELSLDAQEIHKKRKQLTNLQFSKNNLLDSADNFDLIICLDVFEHVEDYFGFLRELKNRGKMFIFNIPLDMNVLKILTPGIKYAREEVGHLHYFSEYSAIETLKDCGYRIKSYKLIAAYLSILPRNIRQLLILPIRLLSVAFGKKIAAKIFGGVSLVVYAE